MEIQKLWFQSRQKPLVGELGLDNQEGNRDEISESLKQKEYDFA